MKKWIKKSFLNERVVLAVILLNTIIIYMQESGITHPVLVCGDILCTCFFICEMVLKMHYYGFREYWHDGWNCMDGILVILSLPSLVVPFVSPTVFNFSTILTIRLLRILRFFRLLHFFPNITQLWAGLKRALNQSGAVLVGFCILLLICSLINCSLFRDVVPEYFGTPLRSIYTMFRLITIEGWYEIPDAIASVTSAGIAKIVRLYFSIILALGGILGLSFINSVFVDAMVEDNNDDVKQQLRDIEQKLDELLEKEK